MSDTTVGISVPQDGPGRPTKFTEETKRKIRDAVSLGMNWKLAAARGGVSYDTLRDWIVLAQKEGEGGEYFEFLQMLHAAKAEHAARNLATIEKAKETDWKAAAWALERVHPDVYGRTVHELQGKGGKDLIPKTPTRVTIKLVRAKDGRRVDDEAPAPVDQAPSDDVES